MVIITSSLEQYFLNPRYLVFLLQKYVLESPHTTQTFWISQINS